MFFKCLLLFVCLTAICAQKGGRKPSASEQYPVRAPVHSARKGLPQESERIEQVYQSIEQQKEEDPDEKIAQEDEPVPAVLPPPSRPLPQLRPLPRLQSLPPPRPIVIAAPRYEEDPGHPAPEPYSVGWSVDDPETGAKTGRSETQDASGEVRGFYYIIDAEGRSRRVDYTAGRDGFRANIATNEEGVEVLQSPRDSSPADVNIEKGPEVAPQPLVGRVQGVQVIRAPYQPAVRLVAPSTQPAVQVVGSPYYPVSYSYTPLSFRRRA